MAPANLPIRALETGRTIPAKRTGWLASFLLAAVGIAIALHHPLGSAVAAALFVSVALAGALYPQAWLVILPAALPLIGLAPWSGWLTFEEFDLLVLALAAGSYAALARQPRRAASPRRGSGSVLLLVLTAYALALMVSAWRGIADAGGWHFDWFQGYHEPLNSLRLAKPFFLAALLWPLWRAADAESPDRAASRLSLGLMLGLLGVALAAVWERLAYTGLLNFSTDYRTSALFWEMHVGGAAIDGFLVLTLPFALRELLVAGGRRRRWVLAALVSLLAAYVCLTTFSRAVYLALPASALVLVALSMAQRRRSAAGASLASGPGFASGIALTAAFAAAAAWMFPSSGYRGLLALAGTMMALLLLAPWLRGLRLRDVLLGVLSGAVLALLSVLGTEWLPKGAYLGYTAAALFVAASIGWLHLRRSQGRASHAVPLALAGLLWMISGMAHVAWHWGGGAALERALVVSAILGVALLTYAARRGPAQPVGWRWQAATLGAMLMAGAVVTVFAGGAYMGERFSTGAQDLAGRMHHWRQGLALLSSPADWLLGKGIGRFPAQHYLASLGTDHPGDYRLRVQDGNATLALSGGTHVLGWGEVLRVSQRVSSSPITAATVRADVRSDQALHLHFEVCEKHLLYNGNCLVKQVSVAAKPGVWQPVQLRLDGPAVSHGASYAPKLLVFSVAMSTSAALAEVDNLALALPDGTSLLANGDFSAGMARWFFSSDRHHLPWHIKSLPLHLLFDQGAIGLALAAALVLAALWRVTFGHGREHPLAPAIAAAVVGFAVVGAFDSLLDVPRIAFLFYLLVLVGLTVRGPRGGAAAAQPSARSSLSSLVALLLYALAAWPASSEAAELIQVGPGRTIATIAQAARVARPGATIEVDAGDYVGDVAVWAQDRLTLRAVGGRVRLLAAGAAAEGKAIWVVRSPSMTVEGFDFEGATVPSRNGAGIRHESGHLRVRDCSFMHNEMGLLTGNDPQAELDIEDSEFAYNRRPDGHNHQLYAGTIKRLAVRGSWFHHGHIGHLLKSRAALNHITYNRLSDEADGRASYELEFPNGGVAIVVGNIIQQASATENPELISYGAEGYRWPENRLLLAHNTLVDDRTPAGAWLRVWPREGGVAVRAVNNLLVGTATWEVPPGATLENNPTLARAELGGGEGGGYRPLPGVLHTTRAAGGGAPEVPERQYRHPRRSSALTTRPAVPGALQPTSPR